MQRDPPANSSERSRTMPKVRKNAAKSFYTITFRFKADGANGKEKFINGWSARNSFDATESFERAHPDKEVIRIEREVVSHLS